MRFGQGPRRNLTARGRQRKEQKHERDCARPHRVSLQNVSKLVRAGQMPKRRIGSIVFVERLDSATCCLEGVINHMRKLSGATEHPRDLLSQTLIPEAHWATPIQKNVPVLRPGLCRRAGRGFGAV